MSETSPNIPGLLERYDYYKTSVGLAIRDLLVPGDLFFDVGANVGGLSVAGSRAVGPLGHVVAFEASPRNVPQLMANLRHWNANNVFVMPNAVWSQSGETRDLYFGQGSYADSVMAPEAGGTPDVVVSTVSLDDMVERLGKAPAVVKMAVEGAELEALRGFEKTIAAHHPALILQINACVQSGKSDDETVPGWLRARGYRIFEADDFKPFTASSSLKDARLANIVCIHESDAGRLARYEDVQSETVAELGVADLQSDAESSYFGFGKRPPGRYMLEFVPADLALHDEKVTTMATIAGPPWSYLNVHVSFWSHLLKSYARQPFHLDVEARVVVRLKDRSEDDIPHMLKSISLKRLVPKGEKTWPTAKVRL